MRDIIGWIAAIPLIIGMGLGRLAPYVFATLGLSFGLGFLAGAWWF